MLTASGPARPTSSRWLAGALAVPLAVFAAVGSFARYTADDYCWAGILRTEGFLRAQALWYVGYSPRYAFTFVVNVVELAGPAVVPALPLTAILVWLAALTWTLRQFGMRTWPALVLAETLLLATFVSVPDLPQSLYWQTGVLTYVLPLILASLLVGWLRRAWRLGRASPASLLFATVLTFVAGGLSETYLVPQNVALTLALGRTLLVWRDRELGQTALRMHLAAALVGGVLSLAVIVAAPATASRVGGSPADLWLASSAAIATAAYGVARVARFFPHAIVLCLLVPGLLGLHRHGSTRRGVLGVITAAVVITLPFCYLPSFYAQNGNPPARSLIVPGALLTAYLTYVGYALAGLVAARTDRVPGAHLVATAIRVGIGMVIPLFIAATTVPQVAMAAALAAQRDATDTQIRDARASGQLDVRVPTLPRYLGENFVGPDPSDWFNVCVARYYDVRSIAAAT